MKSPLFFIVKPKGSQYVSNGDLLINNVSIEDGRNVNRVGIVHAVPSLYNGIVNIGDEIIVHHNVFRITYNQKGIPTHSGNYIKDNMYYVYPDMVYLVIKPTGEKISIDPFVFVEPIIEDGDELPNIGILKYGNAFTEQNGVKEGNKVFFKDFSTHEFNFDNEKLYKMKNKQLLGVC